MLSGVLSHLRQQYAGFLALFIALGGTSYAVATGSINSREIKDNTIKSKDIRDGQVKASDVGNGSLLAEDFGAGQLPQGPKGDTGQDGRNGATNVVVRRGTSSEVVGWSGNRSVSCNPGERATGGGGEASGGSGQGRLVASEPITSTDGATPTGWQVQAHSGTTGGSSVTVTPWVICAAP